MQAIPLGSPTKLNSSPLAAPGSVQFVCQPKPGGGDFSGIFQVVGTVTALTSALQVALDGSTFADLVVAASFLSAAATVKTQTPLVAGAIYKINATAVTGSQDFYLTTN